jgi:hypothetical protein
MDVAALCGVRILGRLPDGQYLGRCPFCGDSRKSPERGHLYLDPEGDRYWCARCWEGGYAVGMYARLRGVDTKTAYREALRGACVRAPLRAENEVTAGRSESGAEPAPLEVRHRVYSEMLSLLGLSREHLHDLLVRRGLPMVFAERYRSAPADGPERWRLCRRLQERGFSLEGVPGFYRRSKNGSEWWDLRVQAGILIPVCNPEGKIQGLQVRLDDPGDGGKYRWVSSAGLPGGVRVPALPHLAFPPGKVDLTRVWVTEGPLKADVAAYLLGRPVLAVPGAGAWRRAAAVLEALEAREAVLAFDMDKLENPAVAGAEASLASALRERGLRVYRARWGFRPECKGLDDYLVFLFRTEGMVAEEMLLEGFRKEAVPAAERHAESVLPAGERVPSGPEPLDTGVDSRPEGGWVRRLLRRVFGSGR